MYPVHVNRSARRRRVLLLILALGALCLAVVIIVAVRPRADTDNSEHLSAIVASVGRDLDFEPVLPKYLPAGIDVANGDASVKEQRLEVFLPTSHDASLPLSNRPFVQLFEARRGTLGPQPGKVSGVQVITIKDQPVSALFNGSPSQRVSAELSSTISEVNVYLVVYWQADPPREITLSDEMRAEALEIFGSMIE